MQNSSTHNGYAGLGIDSNSTQEPEVEDTDRSVEQSAQYLAQYKAYIECVRTTFSKPYPTDGRRYCNRTFDGWGCWEDTLAGQSAIIACPSDVITAFDPNLFATKRCTLNGTWWVHPESNAPWSNYTACINQTELDSGTRTLYIYIIGYSISVVSLLVSLFIFCYFRQLQCERITLHRNLFLSYTLCALVWILYYVAVNMNIPVLKDNPVWCRGLHVIVQYLTASNFLWMLCEGFYLHTKLVFAFVSGQKLLLICRVIGWVLPVPVTLIYSISRATADSAFNRSSCWVTHSPLQWIVFLPIILTIFLNLAFLCNIVRLLVTKLRALNSTDANQTKQATRATLILIPLLGIQFVFFMFQPSAESPGRYVYVVFSALTVSLQGFFVSVIYCFFNGEVLSVVRRKWHQRQLMKGRRDTGTMWTISYTHGEERQSIATTTTTEMRRSSSSYDRQLDRSYKLNGVKSNSESKHMLSETEVD